LLEQIWKDEFPDKDVPKDLLEAIRKAIITRWWTVGDVACKQIKYWRLFFRMAICVINVSTTAEAKNKIASGLCSLMQEKSIEAGVAFIAAFAASYLNKHMAWYGETDPNIGTPAFLTFHRTGRHYLMIKHLYRLLKEWKTDPKFERFRKTLEELTSDEYSLLEKLPEKFFSACIDQVHKHNRRYLVTNNLLKAAFSEIETGKWVALLILGRLPVNNSGNLVGINGSFKSSIHDADIDISSWVQFLYDGTRDVIGQIRDSELVTSHVPSLQKIADGLNIWDENPSPEAVTIREKVLADFAALCSNNVNCERLVHRTSQVKQIGKSERRANIMVIAGNDFAVSTYIDAEDEGDGDAADDGEYREGGGKKRALRGRRKLEKLVSTVDEKLVRYAEFAKASTAEEFSEKRKLIEEGLRHQSKTYLEQRQAENLTELLDQRNVEPTANARMRKTGMDIPARLRGNMPLNDVKANNGHTLDLDMELRCRHIVPHHPFAQNAKDK